MLEFLFPIFFGLACNNSRRLPGEDCWSQCCEGVCPPETCEGMIRAGLVSTNNYCSLCDGNVMPTKLQIDISGFEPEENSDCDDCSVLDTTFEACVSSCSAVFIRTIPGVGVLSGSAYLSCCPLLGSGIPFITTGGVEVNPNELECGELGDGGGPAGLCYMRKIPLVAETGCCKCDFFGNDPCECQQPTNCPTEAGLCFTVDVGITGDCGAGCAFVSQIDGICPDPEEGIDGGGFDCEFRGLNLINCLCSTPSDCKCGSASVSSVLDCLPPIEPE